MVAQQVAFLGLGAMGFPMAGHLARQGHQVTVYNRTLSKAQAWQAEYQGQVAATPAEAVRAAEVVFICLGDDASLVELFTAEQGVLAGIQPGTLVVDHTTASAAAAIQLAELLAEKQARFLDAPVSGGQDGAKKGCLTVMVGGDAADLAKAQPLLAAYAKKVELMGEIGKGQLTKMVNQICIGGLLQSLAEAIHFAEQAGLDVEKAMAVISKGAAQSWQMENRHQTMSARQFDFGFSVDWMRKDFSMVLEEARRNGASLPITACVDQLYAEVQQLGGGRMDTSALMLRYKKAD